MVDDTKIILKGGIPVLEAVLPNAMITGVTRPSEAIEYARANRIALGFLDIEIGKTSGLDLCRTLLEIYPRTNVVFLTAYAGYAFDAWSTGACGFMKKPLTPEGVREQLKRLRYPVLRYTFAYDDTVPAALSGIITVTTVPLSSHGVMVRLPPHMRLSL
jgi:two-component SAPR family response regulator